VSGGPSRPLFQFVYGWNDYLGSLAYISNQYSYPLPLGPPLILGDYTTARPGLRRAGLRRAAEG